MSKTYDLKNLELSAGNYNIAVKSTALGHTTSSISNSADYAASSSETWVINSRPAISPTALFYQSINFTSNGYSYDCFAVAGPRSEPLASGKNIEYIYNSGTVFAGVYSLTDGWYNESYRTVTFDSPVDLTTTFGQWLSANAVKQ